MIIDPNTNMPYPPEGYKWLIQPTALNDGFRVLLLEETTPEKKWWSCEDSEPVWGGFGFIPQHKVQPRHLRKAAKKILKKRAKKLRDTALGEIARGRYAGEYPPNKLGGR